MQVCTLIADVPLHFLLLVCSALCLFFSSHSQWFVGGLDDGWVDWMMGGVWGIVMEWMGYMATSSIMPLDGLDGDKLNHAIGCEKAGPTQDIN